jgi:hypothetical protein
MFVPHRELYYRLQSPGSRSERRRRRPCTWSPLRGHVAWPVPKALLRYAQSTVPKFATPESPSPYCPACCTTRWSCCSTLARTENRR